MNSLSPPDAPGVAKGRFGIMPRVRVYDLIQFYSEHCPLAMENLRASAFSDEQMFNIVCPEGDDCSLLAIDIFDLPSYPSLPERISEVKSVISQILLDMTSSTGIHDGPPSGFNNFGVTKIGNDAWIVMEDRKIQPNNIMKPQDFTHWNQFGTNLTHLQSELEFLASLSEDFL